MLTDSELLRRYVEAHDEPAFSELVQRHLSIVFHAALRRANGDRNLAEETTQIVFTQLACRADSLTRHPALLGWLHMSTRFTVSALVRHERRLALRHQLAAAMPAPDPAPPDWDKLQPLIDDVLDALSPEHREAILLRFFARRSFAQIGTALHVSENAARKCVERAIEKLRRKFARQGITATSAALATALGAAPAHVAPASLATTVATSAMAHAAVAASAAIPAGALAFMSTVKFSNVAAAVLLLAGAGALGTAVVTWSKDQARQQTQLDALQAQAMAVRARLRASPPMEATQVQVRTPTNAMSTAEKGRANIMRDQSEIHLLVNTSPLLAPVREVENRLRFQHEFGAFVASRRYPPEKIDVLRRALMNYYEASNAHRAEARLNDGSQLAAALKADLRALFDQVAVSFSESEAQDIRRCFEAQRMMPVARDIDRALAFAGAPLDHVQQLALAMVHAEAASAAKTASPEANRQMTGVSRESGLSVRNQRLLDDASVFLSPRQMELFAEYLRLAQIEADAKLRAREMLKKTSPAS